MEKIIIAPHADDEVIGCFDVLMSKTVTTVLYGNEKELDQSAKSANAFKFNPEVFDPELLRSKAHPQMMLFFPDPNYELHPDHKMFGNLGIEYNRQGLNVVFYVTNMLAPYIFERKDPEKKMAFLNNVYHWKKDLWQYDYKYFLFEGYAKYYFNTDWKI